MIIITHAAEVAERADVLCLQEVQNRQVAEKIANNSGYKYWYFANYKNDEEMA